MSYHSDDTICAIATAAGGAARGMVRVSGQDAVAVVARCFHAQDGVSLNQVRRPSIVAALMRIAVNGGGTDRPHAPPYKGGEFQLPCDLFVWPTNRSYTREPVVELHTLGSPPLLRSLLDAVCRAGARLAEPGEFTLRAFLAGRLDLTQAEAVLGVIDAQGSEELGAALTQLAGGLAGPLHALRDDLLQLLAELEAGLDFVEEDIEFVSAEVLQKRLASAGKLLEDVSGQLAARHTARHANQIALVGPPNVGKSSLFNALAAKFGVAGRTNHAASPAALVSPQRGTTRDYLTATISLGGIECELVDTAGMEQWQSDAVISNPPTASGGSAMVEAAAHAMAAERGARAVVRAHCVDAAELAAAPPDGLNCVIGRTSGGDVIVLTKCDLAGASFRVARQAREASPIVRTSSRTGEGLAALCDAFRTLLAREEAAQRGQVVAATADRCRESIRAAAAAMERARQVAAAQAGDELVAVEIRVALHELGKVVGAIYTDDLLDRIFSTFCIGK